MNTPRESTPLPDTVSVTPELCFDDTWNATDISKLIRSKCEFGETPSFLFIGKKEADLLRDHLAEVFGMESVTTLHDTYYMGLEVVEVACKSFFLTGGRKTSRTLQDPTARRPSWHDPESDALWQLRI